MAEQDKPTPNGRKISDDERFHYIGFDVFPGKPRDLFSSDSEKAKLVELVVKKRSTGEILREQCSLLLARISGIEKTVLIVACMVALLSVFAPWYSAYNEIEVKPTVAATTAPAATAGQADQSGTASNVETLTGVRIQKKMRREYGTMLGIGAIASIGTVGGAMFSSGFALILTALVMLAYTLGCIGIPIYILMFLFKSKKLSDEFALEMKRLLRLCWLPVLLFVFAFILSFFGGDYASGVTTSFSSLGKSYGPGAFLGTLSWGIMASMGAFLVLAFKGIEI